MDNNQERLWAELGEICKYAGDNDDPFVVWLPKQLIDGMLDEYKTGRGVHYERAKELLNEVEIYDHFFSPPQDWQDVVPISIVALERLGVIEAIVLKCRGG